MVSLATVTNLTAADRLEALAIAADQVLAQFPDALVPQTRKVEASIYLVASALEARVLEVPAARRLESALVELGGFYRPLLQDDVTRRRLSDAARTLDRVCEPLLAPIVWQPADGELLGSWFEGGLAAGHRKRLGQFYTPQAIVDFLLERALAPFDPRRAPLFRVLDPACGAGHFLAPAAALLFEAYRRHRDDLAALRPGEAWDDDALIHRIFTRHLVGVDIDPFAVRIARIRLRLMALSLGASSTPQPVILHGDSLYRHEPAGGVPASTSATNGSVRLPQTTEAGHGSSGLPELDQRFGAIVGNPPYGAQLEPSVAKGYHLGRGRCDSTALFIERALELAEPGGRVAFVVPHGLTRTGAYAPCRTMLAEQARMLALLDAGQAFPGVNLEAMAFVAERNTSVKDSTPKPPIELWTMRTGPLSRLGEQAADFYRDRPTLPIYIPGDLAKLVARLEKAGTELSALCRIRRGSPISARYPGLQLPAAATGAMGDVSLGLPDAEGMPGNARQPIESPTSGNRSKQGNRLTLLDDQAAASGGVQVVRGRDISRYGPLADLPILGSGADLFDAHVASALAEPRVGYQNIASGIVATWLPAGVLPLDTVNVLDPLVEIDQLALLAYLNSRLADWYFKVAIANMAQLTVHLDSPTLGSLPVLVQDPAPLAELARALLAARQSGAGPAALDELAEAIDAAVFSRAGLTASERTEVLRATRPSLARSGRRKQNF